MKNIFLNLNCSSYDHKEYKKYNQDQEYQYQMINIEHKNIPFDHLLIFLQYAIANIIIQVWWLAIWLCIKCLNSQIWMRHFVTTTSLQVLWDVGGVRTYFCHRNYYSALHIMIYFAIFF